MRNLFLFLVLSVFLVIGQANATTYNIGPGETYETFAAFHAAVTPIGDDIIDGGGNTFYEQIVPNNSGTSGHLITYQNFTVHGGSIVTSWTGPDGNGVYNTSSGIVNFVVEDTNVLNIATDATCSDGNWFYDTKLYYKPTSGVPGNHSVYRISRSACVSNANGESYLKFSNITFEFSHFAFYISKDTVAINSIYIDNCTFLKNQVGINCFARNATNENINITNSVFKYNNQSIFLGSYNNGVDATNNITISANTIQNTGYTENGSANWLSAAGFSYDEEGIGVQNINTGIISENIISGDTNDGGIVLWVNAAGTFTNVHVTRNTIKNLNGFGISCGGEGTDTLYANYIIYNLIKECSSGLRINRDQTPSNYVLNNTIIDCNINIDLYNLTDNYIIKNNISLNSIGKHINITGTINANVLDYNAYYSDGATMFSLGGSDYNFSGWRTASGEDVNSIADDPLFRNTTRNKYTLKAGSPCLNAGTDVSLTRDHNNWLIVGTPSIGAYQYTQDVYQKDIGTRQSVNTKTSTGMLSCSDSGIINVDCTDGNISLYLPPLVDCRGLSFIFSKADATTNTLTVLPSDSGGTIDGAVNKTLDGQYNKLVIIGNDNEWSVL